MKKEEEWPTMPHNLESMIPRMHYPGPISAYSRAMTEEELELENFTLPNFEDFAKKKRIPI